jgi:hypothetical protein
VTVALSSLNFVCNSIAKWAASVNEAGFLNPVSNTNSEQKVVQLGNTVANNAPGGSDELYAAVLSIAASGSTTITITNLVDVVNQTGMAFARLKFWRFHLLSPSDNPAVGTICSSVTVGNAASHPFAFNMNSGADTFIINNGSFQEYGDPGATGFTVTASTNDQIKIVNNDSVNAAAVLVILCGGST